MAELFVLLRVQVRTIGLVKLTQIHLNISYKIFNTLEC